MGNRGLVSVDAVTPEMAIDEEDLPVGSRGLVSNGAAVSEMTTDEEELPVRGTGLVSCGIVAGEIATGIREGLAGRGKVMGGSGMAIVSLAFFAAGERTEFAEKAWSTLPWLKSKAPFRPRPEAVGEVDSLACAASAFF